MHNAGAVLISVMLLSSVAVAQRHPEEIGLKLGPIRVRPEAEVLGAYDNRVSINETNGDVEGDLYSEAAAALYVGNDPVHYAFSASAGYGYRFYSEYADLNSDFYHAGLVLSTDNSPLKLGVSSYVRKTLDYDTLYEIGSGEDSSAILTGDTSTRYTTRASAAYEKNLSDKTSIAPGYDVWHYFQNFETQDDAEWLVHRASLQVGYGYTEKTRLYLTGYYSLQINEEEDGMIGGLTVGAEGGFSEKTRWLAHIGVAAADYEQSGADQGVIGRLRANWDMTEKVSAYIYGASDFQPGYNGGDARRIHRLGYGLDWNIVISWRLGVQALHDYEEELNQPAGSENEVKNFFTARSEYDLTQRLTLGASVNYSMDEYESDQTVAALSVVYRY